MKQKDLLSTLLAAVLGLVVGHADAADYRRNPFTLAYEGAITHNAPGAVNIQQVTYRLNGLTISANVYTPANYDPKYRYPAVVVAHPNGGVKEQVAGLYAQRLAEQGYIALAADAAYQGASGGFPRHVDKPAHRIEDIHGMADYLEGYPGVDTARLGLLGLCGGGGYALSAAQTGKRFKAIATVSMFNSGLVRRTGYLYTQVQTVQQRLQDASEARRLEAVGGEVHYSGDANLTDAQIAVLPFDLYRQGYAYYGTSHAHPRATFRYTTSSLLDLMRWDATQGIELITQPLLMIAGTKADSRYMTVNAFGRAGTRDKELFELEGATHIDTYWVPEHVDAAVEKLSAFYGRTI
ncbi:MAG: alpha/beta hydrolase [Pseudoxanthomonas sp.]